jgi:hypothetical protein
MAMSIYYFLGKKIEVYSETLDTSKLLIGEIDERLN